MPSSGPASTVRVSNPWSAASRSSLRFVSRNHARRAGSATAQPPHPPADRGGPPRSGCGSDSGRPAWPVRFAKRLARSASTAADAPATRSFNAGGGGVPGNRPHLRRTSVSAAAIAASKASRSASGATGRLARRDTAAAIDTGASDRAEAITVRSSSGSSSSRRMAPLNRWPSCRTSTSAGPPAFSPAAVSRASAAAPSWTRPAPTASRIGPAASGFSVIVASAYRPTSAQKSRSSRSGPLAAARRRRAGAGWKSPPSGRRSGAAPPCAASVKVDPLTIRLRRSLPARSIASSPVPGSSRSPDVGRSGGRAQFTAASAPVPPRRGRFRNLFVGGEVFARLAAGRAHDVLPGLRRPPLDSHD